MEIIQQCIKIIHKEILNPLQDHFMTESNILL